MDWILAKKVVGFQVGGEHTHTECDQQHLTEIIANKFEFFVSVKYGTTRLERLQAIPLE